MSGDLHLRVDGQGGYSNFDIFTSRGADAFSAWAHTPYFYSVGQINLGYIPMSKADTFYSGSILNIARWQFFYQSPWYSGQATSYLADQWHLTANQPSAVSSVSNGSFLSIDPPTRSARNPAVNSTNSAPDPTIKSFQIPPNSTAKSTTTPNPTNNLEVVTFPEVTNDSAIS